MQRRGGWLAWGCRGQLPVQSAGRSSAAVQLATPHPPPHPPTPHASSVDIIQPKRSARTAHARTCARNPFILGRYSGLASTFWWSKPCVRGGGSGVGLGRAALCGAWRKIDHQAHEHARTAHTAHLCYEGGHRVGRQRRQPLPRRHVYHLLVVGWGEWRAVQD